MATSASIGEAKVILSADDLLTAKIQQAEERLASLQAKAEAAGGKLSYSFREANEATRLLSEELGVHMPRALTSFLARAESIGPVIAKAFSAIAIVGFVDVGITAVGKLAGFMDKLSGYAALERELTQAEKDAATASDNYTHSIQQQIEARIKLGMTETQQLAFDKSQAQAVITSRTAELQQLEQEHAAMAARLVNTSGFVGAPGGSLIAAGLDKFVNRGTQTALDTLDARMQEVRSELAKAQGDVALFGDQAQKAFSDEAAKSAEKLQQELEGAYESLTKIIGVDKNAATMQSIGDAAQVFHRAGINAGPLTSAAFGKLQNEQFTAASDAAMQKAKEQATELQSVFSGMDASLMSNLNAAGDKFDELLKRINAEMGAAAATEKDLQARLTAEGASRLEIEQKIASLRQAEAQQLRPESQRLSLLAGSDPTQQATATKVAAQIDALTIKSKTLSTTLRGDVRTSFEQAFEGITMQTESVSNAFRRMAESILADLSKMIFETYVWKSASGLLGGVFGGLFGGGGNIGDTGISSLTEGVGDFSILAPHALGGSYSANVPMLVGENGPEIVMPNGSGGQVIPNGKLGGDTINVFAKDSTSQRDMARLVMAAVKAQKRSTIASIREHQLRT